jgi:membrane peptidoglycan carboxypeptidase
MSIIKNIKTKKFTRGASTISMQLVKNVFLNREKTLSRKLEEIVLVYVMENSKIVSKQRMLEVYFNVIEWGPNVYGIGEAAHFYFQKTPNQLSLNESLFLASIVPSPKKFMYRFNEQGELRPYAKNQLDITRNLMLRRGLINETDTIGSNLQLKIEGNAKSYIRIKEKDSIVVDSLSPNLEFDF